MQTPGTPPRNPLYPWLRFLLWILPTGFLVISAGNIFNFFFLAPGGRVTVIWASILIYLFFVIGMGWCDYKLYPPLRKEYQTSGSAVLLFCLGQIFIAPLLAFTMFFVVVSVLR